MTTLGTLHAYDRELTLCLDQYPNKRSAVRLESDEGEPYGVLTVNLPKVALAPNEILVKTWSENEALREPALATGLFTDTGKRVPAGFALAEVWTWAGQVPSPG